RDMCAAIARRSNAPEDQDAEQQLAKIIGIRDGVGEKVPQQNSNEDIGGDDADKKRRNQFDCSDECIHLVARCPILATSQLDACSFRHGCLSLRPGAVSFPLPFYRIDPVAVADQNPALYWASEACSPLRMASGSPPTLRTSSPHFL